MRGVQFEDETTVNNNFSYTSRRILGEYQKPGIVGLMQKTGFVNTEKQGYYLLVSFVIFAFLLSGAILWFQFFRHHSQPNLNLGSLTPTEINSINSVNPTMLKEYPYSESAH